MSETRFFRLLTRFWNKADMSHLVSRFSRSFHILTERLNDKHIFYPADKAASSLCLFPHCRDLSLRLVFYAAGSLSGTRGRT